MHVYLCAPSEARRQPLELKLQVAVSCLMLVPRLGPLEEWQVLYS